MELKIDTKEKFTVITPNSQVLTANIAAELEATCRKILENPVKNLILNLSNTTQITEGVAEQLIALQTTFYENSASFVVCSIQEPVEAQLESLELLELINATPTESEAWDIVQMEEIERELLDGDNMEFDKHE